MDDFTKYDIKPEGFINYLRYYGEHFNKKLCEFACKQLPKAEYTKESLDVLLHQHQIQLEYAKLYDHVYTINLLKYIFFSNGIDDEKHLLQALAGIFKNEGKLLFNHWYADMAKKGIPVDWDEMI